MAAGLERLYAVEAHARGAAPDEGIAVFKQDMARFFCAFEAAEEENTLQPEGYGNDGLRQVALVAVLVQSKFRACLVAVDVA